MYSTVELTKKSWILSALTLWMYSTVFERALAPADKWLAGAGDFHYLGMLLVPVALALAASVSTSTFLRKYGATERAIRVQKVLVPSFLLVWGVLSLLLIGALSQYPNGFIEFASIYVAEYVVGAGLAFGAVLLVSRQRRQISARKLSI